MTPISTRATKSKPCPRCDTGTKGCSMTDDGMVLCRGDAAQPGEWADLLRGKLDDAGFGHYRRTDDTRHKSNGNHKSPRPHFKGKPVTVSKSPAKDWTARAEGYAKNLSTELRQKLATGLGLPSDGLDCIPMLGFNPADSDGPCVTFPEMDAAGHIIGISCRYAKGPDGKTPKKSMLGCKRGLSIPEGWRDRDGPLFIVEGPTDVAALTACGLASVGRPSNVGGVELLAELLRDWPADRAIVVCGENDGGPGVLGEKVAQGLAAKLNREILWSMPPEGYKDARELVSDYIAGAGDVLDCPAYGQEIHQHFIESATPVKPAATTARAFRFIDSATLDTGDFRPRWIIKGVLVEKQPTTNAGPSKGLKTNLTIDEAVSIAAGVPFLGRFPVPHPRRVAVVSGESGAGTLQETARRICAAKGLNLADLGDKLVWCFDDMPTFSDIESMTAFAKEIAKLKAEVVVLDPTYLMLGDVDAKNLFEMGAAFRVVSEVLIKAGSTPILLHHANRQIERGRPMELTDLAYSGLEQFVRQFILINRRVPYQDDGVHDLWLRCGGSAGHGGLWNTRIVEGLADENFGGRKWEIEIQTADEAKEDRQREKEQRATDKRAEERQKFLDAIDEEVRAGHEAATRTKLKSRTGFNTTKVREMAEELVEDGIIEPHRFKKPTGQGAKRESEGWRRAER